MNVYPRPARHTAGTLAIACVLATSLACEPTTILVSEQEQLTFEPEGITAGAERALRGVRHVLDGTELRGPVDLYPADDEDERDVVEACFTQDVSGPAQLDGTCLVPTGLGVVTWTFEARTCPGLPEAVDDAFELTVVDPAGAAPRLEFAYRDAAHDEDFRVYLPGRSGPIPGPELPADLWPAEGEPVHWLEGGRAELFVGFFTAADDERLLWARSDVEVTLDPTDGDAPDLDGPPNHPRVHPSTRGSGTIEISRDDDTWSVGTWATTAPDEVASLALLVFATVDEEDGVETPLAVRAVVRDDAGNPVFGAPIAWGVAGRGPAALQLLEPDGDASYALLTPGCLPAPATDTTYTQRVQAKLGTLTAEAPITWIVDARDPEDTTEFVRSEHCIGPLPGTCGCTTSKPGPAAVWSLLALGLALRRRRS